MPSINTSAFSQARSRLPIEVLEDLTRKCAEKLEKNVPSNWLWKNKSIKLIDGTTLSMPDTEENQLIYPQNPAQKPGIGFPIARIVTVISYITGAVMDIAIGPYAGEGSSELALLRQIMHIFKPGDIAMGDKYYPTFFLMAELKSLGIDGIFPLHYARNSDFRRGERLGSKEHIVHWVKPKKPIWMEQEKYDGFPENIEIREVSIQSNRKGFRTKSRIIITTFLDPKYATKENLAALYEHRWCIEVDLRTIKDVMHMDVLRGKTPEMVQKEIWAHLLAYNLIRKIMSQAAVIHDKKPRELSFKLTLQLIEAFRERGIFAENKYEFYSQLLHAVAYKRVGDRSGRQEPRRVKRRPKPYALLMKPRYYYHKKTD